jgi:two-component system chemotaxis response regulator CheY
MKTILVVEDVASVRLYHANLIRQLGHAVVSAADGCEGLAKLREARVDLVLLDMLMPGMGGLEFLERLRADPSNAALPVVVVTSEGAREHEERFLAAGASAFLVKPALPEAMEAALRQWIT